MADVPAKHGLNNCLEDFTMKQLGIVLIFILACGFIVSGASAQTMLLEDCNDANPASGFWVLETNGSIIPNETDAETWTFHSAGSAWGGWNDFDNDSLMSPDFKADAFTVRYVFRNVQRGTQSDWDNIAVRVQGLAQDLVIYLGSSSNNGEIFPEYALYAEIQHPDKANGYIWDSKVNLNNQPVPPPWSDYIDEFPGTVAMEIVFQGPNQPLDIYYNFDGKGRTHLLQWNDTEPSHTFDGILGKAADRDTYSVAIHANVGDNPPLSFDLDYFKIAGNIESEYAVPDPDYTRISDWSLF